MRAKRSVRPPAFGFFKPARGFSPDGFISTAVAFSQAGVLKTIGFSLLLSWIGHGVAPYPASSLPNACVFGNQLGKGVTFHAQITEAQSLGWFFKQNTYYNGTNVVATPFLDPVGSSAHISQ